MSTGDIFTLDAALAETQPQDTPRVGLTHSRKADMSTPHAEWRPLAGLHDIALEWHALAIRALEPNVFYDPAFALAAAAKFGRGVGAVLVWSDDTKQRLIGLFPAWIERFRYGMPLPLLVGWTHPYAPFGVPLVDSDEAEAAITTWLDFIGHAAFLPRIVLLPYLSQSGPFATLLQAALATRGGNAIAYSPHERAMLEPGLDRKRYADNALSPKKRRELRRQANRISERRTLSLLHAEEPSAVASALEDFLHLESVGWKGRAGTAAASNPATRAFLVSAVQGLASSGQAHVARLLVREKTIAAGILLRSGPAAWFWKIAYDEAYAAASPGAQLTFNLTEHLLADATLARTDSCATADHPMIDHFWRERLSIADLLIAPAPSAAFKAVTKLEHARRRAIANLRAIKRLLRS